MAKYTDRKDSQNILVYENILKPSIKLGKDQVVGGDYKYTNNDTEIEPGSPIINAIDINWGSVILNYLNGTTNVYTTSDLLKYIQTLNDTIVSNKINGIIINGKEYAFDETTGIAEVDDLIGNISIKVATDDIDNNILLPDENGIIDLSNILSDIKDDVNSLIESGITDSIQAIEGTIEIHSASINDLYNTIDNLPKPVKPNWNATAGSDAEILNKPTIPSAQDVGDWAAARIESYMIEGATVTNLIDQKLTEVIKNGEFIGEKGDPGISAYEMAVKIQLDSNEDWNETSDLPAEYQTPQNWINSLYGAQGEKGDKGDPGNAISIKTFANDCEFPGDSYIEKNPDGDLTLKVLQGYDEVTGEKVFEDCDINLVVTPGSPPIIGEDGNWNWWEYDENTGIGSYISSKTVDGQEYGPYPAQGPQGTTGLDTYNLASSIYYANNASNPNVRAFPGTTDWLNLLIPKITDSGLWGIKNPVDPYGALNTISYEPVAGQIVQAEAIGKPGAPGKSPRITATTIDNQDTYIWEIWDANENAYVPAIDSNNEYIIAQGKDGRDGHELSLKLISMSEFITNPGYVKFDTENNVVVLDSAKLENYNIENGFIAISYTENNLNEVQFAEQGLTKEKFRAFLRNVQEDSDPNSTLPARGVYYITNYPSLRLEYAGVIEGENGVSGKSAYEIALTYAIEQWKINNPGQEYSGTSDLPEKYQTEQNWIDSLSATVTDADKEEIKQSVLDSLDLKIEINDVPFTNTNSVLSAKITGENIEVSSTNSSTIADIIQGIVEPNDASLIFTIDDNPEHNKTFSANSDQNLTIELGTILGTIINNAISNSTLSSDVGNLQTTVQSLSGSVDNINLRLGSVELAIGFDEEDFGTIETLKNVIDELTTPEGAITDSVLDTVVEGIGNKVEQLDLIIPSSDFTTPATLSINKSNPTADLSDKIVTGISVNGNTLSPATGLVTIGSVVTNIKYTTKDEHNEDQIINITNNDGNISLNDFAKYLMDSVASSIETATTQLNTNISNNYLASSTQYVSGIKIVDETNSNQDINNIVATTGTVVLSLADYAKKMQLIIRNYTVPTTINEENTYETLQSTTLNIGNTGENISIDMSAYATIGDINTINATLVNNYYSKASVDTFLKWDIIS